MKIIHNNKEYTLDIEGAINSGFLKWKYFPSVGDVFKRGHQYIVLTQDYKTKKFIALGLFNSIQSYNAEHLDSGDVMNVCAAWGFSYVGNANENLDKCLREFVSKAS